jgi:hypothetical protein
MDEIPLMVVLHPSARHVWGARPLRIPRNTG